MSSHISTILASKLSQREEKLTDTQTITVHEAMLDYAKFVVNNYKDKQKTEPIKQGVGFFKSFFRGELSFWVRRLYFNRAKRQALIRRDMENHKIYVIQSGNYSYQVLSTRDVELNRKLRILGKNVDAKKLHEIADFVAVPQIANVRPRIDY